VDVPQPQLLRADGAFLVGFYLAFNAPLAENMATLSAGHITNDIKTNGTFNSTFFFL